MKQALTAFSAILILGLSGLSHAQTVTGTILGTVLDSAGGAVSQAHIAIMEENTGRKREMIRTTKGGYLAAFLAGTYTLLSKSQASKSCPDGHGASSRPTNSSGRHAELAV
jgi:hypothetical protein